MNARTASHDPLKRTPEAHAPRKGPSTTPRFPELTERSNTRHDARSTAVQARIVEEATP
jgi:hypothetical protein